ncbi:MAG: hypothetical protein A4E19_15530 [Nitrospira sp. SG-bin1]|nr:MAG: hypothetical protein A4E19_15530 [Nitrospira sp. SG-bin1]
MKCDRCNGLVIAVSFVGGDDQVGIWAYDGWKCVNCGDVRDPLLMKNRSILTEGGETYRSAYGGNVPMHLQTQNAA